jgi:tRNA(Leu) C34 or U34 (ribose-2'-O)-methylase TrmL
VAAALEGGAQFEAIYVDADEASSPGMVALTEPGRWTSAYASSRSTTACWPRSPTPRRPNRSSRPFASRRMTSKPIACQGLILVVHDLKDPGNAGTIIRSADAAGVTAVIFTGQSVDPYNPKTLRATAGSIFHLDVCVATLDATLAHFAAFGRPDIRDRRARWHEPPRRGLHDATVVLIGNEAEGLSDEVIATLRSLPSRFPWPGAANRSTRAWPRHSLRSRHSGSVVTPSPTANT